VDAASATAAVPVPIAPAATPYYPGFATDPMAIRAGNAVGTMLFGGVGILLGLAAYKVVRREGGVGA
jgi:hypothetical protein